MQGHRRLLRLAGCNGVFVIYVSIIEIRGCGCYKVCIGFRSGNLPTWLSRLLDVVAGFPGNVDRD